MKGLKVTKRVAVCVSIVAALVISFLFSSKLIEYEYLHSPYLDFYLSTFLGKAYSSYEFIFFVVVFAFPIISGLIDNKISSITLSSLGMALLIPLVVSIFKAGESFYTLKYNDVPLSSCVLNPSFFVAVIGLILIIACFLAILISSIFIKEKQSD